METKEEKYYTAYYRATNQHSKITNMIQKEFQLKLPKEDNLNS